MTGATHDGGIAVVAGAASGIGRAVADELAAAQWTVVGLDRHESSSHQNWIVDVSDRSSVIAAIEHVEAEVGPIRSLVVAAGHYERLAVGDITAAQWRTMLRVHLGGFVNLAQAVLPGMIDRRDGSIIAITSDIAVGGGDCEAHYAAAKGAVGGLIRSLALEVGEAGVRVNGVAPGPTNTPMIGPTSPWRDPAYLATIPLRRLIEPAEIATAVRYLAEDAGFVTGEILSPNAGTVI